MTDIKLPGEQGLKAMLVASILIVLFSMVVMYYLLLQMELQKTLTLPNKLEFDEEDDDNNTEVKKDEGSGESDEKQEEIVSGRMVVSTGRKVLLVGLVSLLVILSYSMLVLSQARSWISWIAMMAVLGIVLHSHIQDEVRRQRLDRLAAILSFVLLITMALQLAVYSSRQVFDGQVFEGRARIVGYDMDVYDQDQGKDSVTRTDLVVAWGGSWGCPNHPERYCEAVVHGALCEVEDNENDNNNNRSRRQLGDDNGDNNGGDDKDANDNADNAEEEELEDEVEEMEDENEELEEENEELEDENEVDEEVIDEYEEYTEDLEDEIIEEEDYTYYYDDDMYEDSYWDEQDWDQVWGEYACADLFSADLAEEQDYDPDTPAGQDEWPFVNIYGDCMDCTADLVNYYSKQYFRDVQDYKKAARNYGLAAGLSFVVTLLLAAKQRFNPTADKELELLSRHGPSALA